MSSPYYGYHHDEFAHVGPPPVVPVAPAPSSFNSHHLNTAFDPGYAPQSPLVVPASPTQSDYSRASSHHRHSSSGAEYVMPGGSRQAYLKPSAMGGSINRSQSERHRGIISVENPHRGRSRSFTRKMYYDDDGYSAYSGSSYGSREPSRSRSISRKPVAHQHHARSPSYGSEYESEDEYGEYALAPRGPPRLTAHEEELARQLEAVQLQLAQVQEGEKKRQLEEEQKRMEKLRNEEIERKVQEEIERQKRIEAEQARMQAEMAERERRRIEDAARQMLEAKEKAEQAQRDAEAAEAAKIAAIVEETKRKIESAHQGKKTFTRFSKVHLCREALEERKLPFTEDGEYFLVQRFVDKPEQKYLWERTKEIRNYYQQIQEAAEKAPTVPGPNGGFVKYVQIAGQAYPLAIPVTIQQTPGGGQTQTVQPVRIKFSDIFKLGATRR